MAGTVISAKYPPLIDVTHTPLAYGNRAVPRLNRELKDETLLTRQRALMSLCDYLHDPEHISTSIAEGIVESLKMLLEDEDVTCRRKSTECLYVMACHAIGRQAIVVHEVIEPLAGLFSDPEDTVRRNVHQAIEMVSESNSAANAIIDAKLVPTLIDKLRTELDEIKELILDTLHFVMKVNVQDALDNAAMEVFTSLLSHDMVVIRYKAARDIMDLSVLLAGKDQAVECKCVGPLVQLLHDDNLPVRANSAGALMMITLTTRGKYTALEAEAIDSLVPLVNDENTEVRVNALKALTNLSEAPEGRKMLLDHVGKIKERESDSNPAVAQAAKIAVKTILWKP
jgi:hypothetical protein